MSNKSKVMTQPINQIFRLLQNKSRIQVMLYEQVPCVWNHGPGGMQYALMARACPLHNGGVVGAI